MCQLGESSRAFEACCCECGPFFRRFISEKEKEERLEKYRDQLKNEIAGVEERIQELKGK